MSDLTGKKCPECQHRAEMHAGRGCCETMWDEAHPKRGYGCACVESPTSLRARFAAVDEFEWDRARGSV